MGARPGWSTLLRAVRSSGVLEQVLTLAGRNAGDLTRRRAAFSHVASDTVLARRLC